MIFISQQGSSRIYMNVMNWASVPYFQISFYNIVPRLSFLTIYLCLVLTVSPLNFDWTCKSRLSFDGTWISQLSFDCIFPLNFDCISRLSFDCISRLSFDCTSISRLSFDLHVYLGWVLTIYLGWFITDLRPTCSLLIRISLLLCTYFPFQVFINSCQENIYILHEQL